MNNKKPQDDLDDILKIINDINKMLGGDNFNKSDKNKNISIEVNGQTLDPSNMQGALNDFFGSIDKFFGGSMNIFSPADIPSRQTEKERYEDYNEYVESSDTVKKIFNKNLMIITKILEMCDNKNLNRIFNSENKDKKINEKILSDNHYADKRIYKLIEDYNIDLSRVKHVSKVLQCIIFAIKKNEIIVL